MTQPIRPLQDAFNEGNPNKIPDANQLARMGDGLAGKQRYLRNATIAAAPAHVLVLPAAAKAESLEGGFIIDATASVGVLQPVPEDAALAAGQAQVTADGDILFLAADVVLEAEVYYKTAESLPITIDTTVVPTTGVADLVPRAGLRLLTAEALTGGVTGVFTVLARGVLQAALATTQAALQPNGETVEFDIGDAVTSARLTFVPQPGFGPTPASVATKMAVVGSL